VEVALPARFERATCGLGNRRSIHLSYGSKANVFNCFVGFQLLFYIVLAIYTCNLQDDSAMKATLKSQTLEKSNIPCLYRSSDSGVFYGIFTRKGDQVKKSLKTTDKELARRRLEALRQKVARLNTKAGKAIVFADLAKRWLDTVSGMMKPSSRLRRETAIKALKPYFGNTVRAIDKSQVDTWAASRNKTASARTFNIERETLIQILDYALREGLILENPARVVERRKQHQARVVIPSKAQFKTLLDTLRQADARYHEAADLCELLAYSGCRLGEATAMVWGDVNLELKTFTVTGGEYGTKNHEARTLPIFPALEEFLLRLQTALRSVPESTKRIVEIDNAKKAMASACETAKLPHFHHHSLRHFFCSNAIEAGIDFKTIAGWLGHKDGGLLVAKTYGHLRDEHSAMMAKRMTFSVVENRANAENVVSITGATA
jgi:integrase